MKVRYDREEDILAIELNESASIDHADHFESVILHVSPQNEPVLLEILDASEFLAELVKASLRGAPAAP
jgi:uncharacterized protein YuzE